MNFQYYVLSGETLNAYLESEKKEFQQKQHRHKVLTQDHEDKIEKYSEDRNGNINAIKFKEGKQPEGFMPAEYGISKKWVRPKKKDKASEAWRKLLDEIKVTENCQAYISKLCNLPTFVASRETRRVYSSRVGHVGDKVFVEIPYAKKTDEIFNHQDFKFVEVWEFEKYYSENTKNIFESGYNLNSRVQG
jgi:hypothetical protein